MAKIRFPFSAGMLVRGQITRVLRQYCDFNGMKYHLKDYGGLLVSEYYFEAEGSDSQIRTIKKFAEGLNKE